MVRVDAEKFKKLIEIMLIKAGMGQEDAWTVSDVIRAANLRGVETHGIRMLPGYIKRIGKGNLNPKGQETVLKETAVTALVDGGNAFGHIAGYRGMRRAMNKAKTSGVGIVLVKNSNHFGAAAYFAMMAQSEGMIGISMTNSSPRMAPTGGRRPIFGVNPWSIAFPCKEGEIPVTLDMANSIVAYSHIIMAQERNEKLPEGWALDDKGRPTTDPFNAPSVVPMGGYKGYAIALAVEALTGILADAAVGEDLINGDDVPPGPVGMREAHLFIAINVEMFSGLDEYKQRLLKFVEVMHNCEKAEGVDRIYVPGEKEFEKLKDRLANGIPVALDIVKRVNACCESLDLSERLG